MLIEDVSINKTRLFVNLPEKLQEGVKQHAVGSNRDDAALHKVAAATRLLMSQDVPYVAYSYPHKDYDLIEVFVPFGHGY
ncbi:MAG: hypothetical protein QNL04_00475 [SAR324 cluster bacterium]|nr:hypothetical protein [SAR324 cluster bacterium]